MNTSHDPVTGRLLSRPAEERFREKVSPEPNTGCWIWTGAVSRRGYGVFGLHLPKRVVSAHRFAWELANGRIPDSLQVLHRCDCPPCVNPEHLFIGTQLDNVLDMMSKGRATPGTERSSKGESNGSAKLTAEQVAEIRRRYQPHRGGGRCGPQLNSAHSLAREFGVDRKAIQLIVHGEGWKHVPGEKREETPRG